jgi:hypothetical protein
VGFALLAEAGKVWVREAFSFYTSSGGAPPRAS